MQLSHRGRGQSHLRCCELAKHSRLRVRRRELARQSFAHSVINNEIVAHSSEQLQQYELIILVGLQAQLAPMVTVREKILIELRDLERLRQVRWVARLNRLNQLPECAIEGVHRCAYSPAAIKGALRPPQSWYAPRLPP
jgi:hypothetical protein